MHGRNIFLIYSGMVAKSIRYNTIPMHFSALALITFSNFGLVRIYCTELELESLGK